MKRFSDEMFMNRELLNFYREHVEELLLPFWNRKGEPIDKVAALPVKDLFHILRNMLLIMDLLADKVEAKG